MKAETVAIIGLDRTTFAAGLALRQAGLGLTVIGYDKEAEVARQARKLGAVDKDEWYLLKAVAAADILILSLAPDELAEMMPLIGSEIQAHTLLLDLSSAKELGIELAGKHLARGHYVGARLVPAAAALNDARADLESAHADLFRDTLICLMPAPHADPQAVQTAVDLGRLLGAKPFFLDAAEYDKLVQGVETLPVLLAAALFHSVTQADGWRDVLRFAGPSFAQATRPLHEPNAAALIGQDSSAALRWLDALMAEMREVRAWVEAGDRELLQARISSMAEERQAWLRRRQENEWEEHRPAEIERTSLSEQWLGGLARRSRGKKEG
jgi:prephenate dehydrogenase